MEFEGPNELSLEGIALDPSEESIQIPSVPMMLRRNLLRFSLYLCLIQAAVGATPLNLEQSGGSSTGFEKINGTVEIKGPLGLLMTPLSVPEPDSVVLDFEYFCQGGIDNIALSPGPPFEKTTSRPLPPMGHSEGWASYSVRIISEEMPLPAGWKQLRLELPLKAEQSVQIRNVKLRAERPGEFDPPASNPNASAPVEALKTYLDTKFPGQISEVSVETDVIHLKGNVGSEKGHYALTDIPIDLVLDDHQNLRSMVDIFPEPDGSFEINVPRFRKRDGLDYDRLTSRWQIVMKSRDGYVEKSHARYAGRVATRGSNLPPAAPKNKKGLGGWHSGRLPDELEELGISAVTVNVVLDSLISLKPAPGSVPTVWQGRTYHMREDRLARLDRTFREAAKANAMVSAIILIRNPAKTEDPVVKLMGHPDAVAAGIYAMPNVTSPVGIGVYGAALNFLAERWTRADGKYGRVHHWIMQNEVDAGWVWTNAGEKPALVFMDLYQRSLRLMHLIARQYDPHSRVFISLTHHWAHHGAPKWYGSKRMLDLLVKFESIEGDFPWALAYHPYPEDLRNPRTWEDSAATFEFSTAKITPKNLEVLDAYMKTPEMRFRGKVRPIHLSENGFNSPNYSKKSLEDQAAGMAMAWKKIQALSSIESWQYHNWIDNRQEGGLRLGLRKYPDDAGDPLGKKPIWYLYQALATPREDDVAAPYLKAIGISSWKEIIHRSTIR